MNCLKKVCVFSILCVLTLSACSGNQVRRNLGLAREAPDEFMVLARPPLSIPPDFDLRPPTEKGDADIVSGKVGQSRNIVFRGTNNNSSLTTTDQMLLRKAGADQADPHIRNLLRADTVERKEEEEGWFGGLTNKFQNQAEDPMIDPNAEETRIKDNIESG
ncbi:MAG: DUF3035 domain-containing protein, partial [Rickettsiales bacterium]|nr:DUF3035 domain-containing protein [Rickettsiales bacterium]